MQDRFEKSVLDPQERRFWNTRVKHIPMTDTYYALLGVEFWPHKMHGRDQCEDWLHKCLLRLLKGFLTHLSSKRLYFVKYSLNVKDYLRSSRLFQMHCLYSGYCSRYTVCTSGYRLYPDVHICYLNISWIQNAIYFANNCELKYKHY